MTASEKNKNGGERWGLLRRLTGGKKTHITLAQKEHFSAPFRKIWSGKKALLKHTANNALQKRPPYARKTSNRIELILPVTLTSIYFLQYSSGDLQSRRHTQPSDDHRLVFGRAWAPSWRVCVTVLLGGSPCVFLDSETGAKSVRLWSSPSVWHERSGAASWCCLDGPAALRGVRTAEPREPAADVRSSPESGQSVRSTDFVWEELYKFHRRRKTFESYCMY